MQAATKEYYTCLFYGCKLERYKRIQCKGLQNMPFYQFNSFTGRIKESTHLQPLHPVSALPLDKANPPKMIWDSIKTRPVKTLTTSSAHLSTVDPNILAGMKKFQANIEKPVFLLGGSKDKILFGITCVLVAGGVAQCLKLFVEMANPKK